MNDARRQAGFQVGRLNKQRGNNSRHNQTIEVPFSPFEGKGGGRFLREKQSCSDCHVKQSETGWHNCWMNMYCPVTNKDLSELRSDKYHRCRCCKVMFYHTEIRRTKPPTGQHRLWYCYDCIPDKILFTPVAENQISRRNYNRNLPRSKYGRSPPKKIPLNDQQEVARRGKLVHKDEEERIERERFLIELENAQRKAEDLGGEEFWLLDDIPTTQPSSYGGVPDSMDNMMINHHLGLKGVKFEVAFDCYLSVIMSLLVSYFTNEKLSKIANWKELRNLINHDQLEQAFLRLEENVAEALCPELDFKEQHSITTVLERMKPFFIHNNITVEETHGENFSLDIGLQQSSGKELFGIICLEYMPDLSGGTKIEVDEKRQLYEKGVNHFVGYLKKNDKWYFVNNGLFKKYEGNPLSENATHPLPDDNRQRNIKVTDTVQALMFN